MKSLYLISLLICAFFFLKVKGDPINYQITYYGCDRKCLTLSEKQKLKTSGCEDEECTATDKPKCYKDEQEAFGNNRNIYFSAISAQLKNYENYCKHFAIVMIANGEKKPLIYKTRIVDSCRRCQPYHLDLGKETFGKLLKLSDGVAYVIWGIYSPNGVQEELFYTRNSELKKTAKAFNMSVDQLVSAFSEAAKQLAKSSNDYTKLGSPSTDNPTKTTTTSVKSSPTGSVDRCGKGYGKCASGLCCSRYGWCGTSSDHCYSGCQSEFGICKSEYSCSSNNSYCLDRCNRKLKDLKWKNESDGKYYYLSNDTVNKYCKSENCQRAYDDQVGTDRSNYWSKCKNAIAKGLYNADGDNYSPKGTNYE